jgi:hypothetical protein
MLDYAKFQDTGEWGFESNAMSVAYRVFFQSIPTSGSISIASVEKDTGSIDRIFIVQCRGQLIVSPILWVGRSFYNIREYTQVKAKFGNTESWKEGH